MHDRNVETDSVLRENTDTGTPVGLDFEVAERSEDASAGEGEIEKDRPV